MNKNIFLYTVDILTSCLSRLISFNFCITDKRESWLVKQGMESQESSPKHITHIYIPQTFFFFKFQGLILFKLHSDTQPSISAWRRKFPVLFHLLSAYIESNKFCAVPRSVHHINSNGTNWYSSHKEALFGPWSISALLAAAAALAARSETSTDDEIIVKLMLTVLPWIPIKNQFSIFKKIKE